MAKKKAAAKEVERKVLSNGVILIKYDDGSYALLTPISAEDAEDIFGGEAEDSEDEEEDSEDEEEDSDEDESNKIFGNTEPLKKGDYFLISEIDGVQILLPKTFETIDEAEKYIKDYLFDPSRIGTTVHILKKDKSLTSEIQIKELTDG